MNVSKFIFLIISILFFILIILINIKRAKNKKEEIKKSKNFIKKLIKIHLEVRGIGAILMSLFIILGILYFKEFYQISWLITVSVILLIIGIIFLFLRSKLDYVFKK